MNSGSLSMTVALCKAGWNNTSLLTDVRLIKNDTLLGATSLTPKIRVLVASLIYRLAFSLAGLAIVDSLLCL